MAIVTNYTLSKLAQSLDMKEDMTEELFVEHIYNDKRLYQFFNRWELKYLFNYKKLLENNNLDYYMEVPTSKDTGAYVFQEESHLKYHLFGDCNYLKRDFRGYSIPPEVREKNLVSEYRNWFVSNKFKDKFEENSINANTIILKYNREFARPHNLKKLNENYSLIVSKPNGGVSIQNSDFDMQKFYKTINQCVQYKRSHLNSYEKRVLGKWEGIQNKSDEEIREKVIELIGVDYLNNYGLDNIKNLWRNYAKVKRGVLLKNLVEYFKWTFINNSKIYDRVVLEDFNLKCCKGCEKTEETRKYINKEKSVDNDLPF